MFDFKKFISTILSAVMVALVVAPGTVTATLWEYYNERGEQLPSVEERAKVAAELGIFDYRGTAEQNQLLEERMKETFGSKDKIGAAVVTRYETTLRASMTQNQTTIPVSSLETFDGSTITSSTIDGEVFLTLDPGTSREEIVKCTDVSATDFTSCTRGLAFSGTDESSVADNKQDHRAGGTVVMSNVHYIFENLVDLDTDETITGSKTFENLTVSSNTLKIGDNTTTTDKKIFSRNGETNEPFLSYDESNDEWILSDDGQNTVVLNSLSSGGLSASTTAGIGITNSKIYVKASSTKGMKFDGSGELYQAVSSTDGLGVDSNGVFIKAGSDIGFDSSGNLEVDTATSTPTADKIVKASSTGKIDSGWITNKYRFGGNGSDGDKTITSSENLDLGGNSIFIKEYSSFDLESGNTLTVTNSPSTGSIVWIKVSGDCTIDGTIDMVGTGADGGAEVSGSVQTGNDGTESSNTSYKLFKTGVSSRAGQGGADTSNNGGGGGGSESDGAGNVGTSNGFSGNGVSLGLNANELLYFQSNLSVIGSGGGSGGLGDEFSNGFAGGTGGKGGDGTGALIFECAGDFVFTGTINLNGQDGENGTSGDDYAGGGGGGGAGTFLGFFHTIATNTGSVNVNGGIGGTGVDPDGNIEEDGENGGDGFSIITEI